MKICLFSSTYPPDVGGVAVSARRIASNLASAGHEIHVLTPSESVPPGSQRTETDGSVTLHRLGAHVRPRETLANWFDAAVSLDAAQDFDLFQGQFLAPAGYLAALVARYRGKTSVVSARGNDVDLMPFDRRRATFALKALEWADVVVAVTCDLARKAEALTGRKDVRVIHNGVDTELFSPQPPDADLREHLGLTDRPVVAFVGEARAKKGLGPMLRVYPRLYEVVAVQMLLVGGVRSDDKEMVKFFQRQHRALPFHLLPPRPNIEMPKFYALSDIVILPSLRDGLPNTLLEAMACGRPVVASAVGGMLDVVTDGHDGLLLPARDDDLWVHTLQQLLLDPETCSQLGASARRTVLDRFTVERELASWQALYQELMPP